MLDVLFSLTKPLLQRLPPEHAHILALEALALLPARRMLARLADYPALHTPLFGHTLPNPLGMAAGFDKDGEVIAPLFALGFGMVEIGTVTPRPQAGNPKPRVFRLKEVGALINRLGFNNLGHAVVKGRVAKHWKFYPRAPLVDTPTGASGEAVAAKARVRRPRGLLGINVGANRDSENTMADYSTGVALFAPMADYLVLNVSSPNTEGLRNLQKKAELSALLDRVFATRARFHQGGRQTPIVLKIAPDLSLPALDDIIAVARAIKVDGMIISNTTITRPESFSALAFGSEVGGLSGRPLFDASTRLLGEAFLRVEGAFPLIGCGGVDSAAGIFAKICAGASAVQLYTGLVYHGPALLSRSLKTLADYLAREKIPSITHCIGTRALEFARGKFHEAGEFFDGSESGGAFQGARKPNKKN